MPSLRLHTRPEDGTLRQRLIERIADGKLALPVLPGSSARVLASCQEPTSNAEELADLIRNDPALTGHVLRVANSAAYAPREPIVDLKIAISRLGLAAFSGIVVGMAVREKMFRMRGFEARLRGLWRHSSTTGAWAMEIAQVKGVHGETSFLAGLLHDVGKAVVLQALGELARSRAEKLDADLCEELMVEFHTSVGATLLQAWSLSPLVVDAVLHHHDLPLTDPDGVPMKGSLAPTVALADLLAHWSLELGPSQRGGLMAAPLGIAGSMTAAGLDPQRDLAPLLARADHVIAVSATF